MYDPKLPWVYSAIEQQLRGMALEFHAHYQDEFYHHGRVCDTEVEACQYLIRHLKARINWLNRQQEEKR